MTIMASASVFPVDGLPREVDVSKEDLKTFVQSGVIQRVDNHREHFAIQPCWIHDPGSGILEELNSCVLGRWNRKLKAYVVAVQNIRNSDHSASMNEDHRWLHVDIRATFYTYTPEENQRMKGEVKKIGNRAAVCAIFDVFTATVFAKDDAELKSWSVGEQIEFIIYSFTHRRKGPILRGKSLSTTSKHRKALKFEESFSALEDEHLVTEENGMDVDTSLQSTLDDSTSSKSKKKKKKRKKNVGDEEEEEASINVDYEAVQVKVEIESPVKKKKKKKKSSSNE